MKVVVFEDEYVPRLYPITLGRPAFAITCGAYRLVDWLRELGYPIHAVVRPHLTDVLSRDYPDLGSGRMLDDDSLLLVNARLVPSRSVQESLLRLIECQRATVAYHDNEVAAVLQPRISDSPSGALTSERLTDYFDLVGITRFATFDEDLPLLQYPHDVIRYNAMILPENLARRIGTGDYHQFNDGLFLGGGATLGAHVVTDTEDGPIVIEQDAVIGPFTFLRGPAYIGYGARVNEHSAIKDSVCISHTTKVGGEVEASVIEPFSNKQHHGFLGHSYLGSWINLGAGTCNSDLKNTYGSVNIEHRGERITTGMQFLGCVIGDYSKTAINTSIFTGKTIGVCSMLYGFVTTNVPSFVNYARLFGQVTELPPEVMIATQQRMFSRRKVEQRVCDVQLLQSMYELTREERQLAGEPLTL